MFSEERYDSLVESIFHRFPSVQDSGFQTAYKPGLEHMEAFDAALGHPSRAFRSVHVAGTNGKGSVASILASVFSARGLKTGLYTSPHLVDFRERMKIDGKMPPKEWTGEFLDSGKDLFDELDLSFFEITTGMAFKWFAENGVDVAVIETGLGGRLDSTNIILPEVSVITSIGLDHCEILGHDLRSIAREKAGIIKPGVPAVIGNVPEETVPVFKAAAGDSSPLRFAMEGDSPLWQEKDLILKNMDLKGKYQEYNLRTVGAVLEVMGIPAGEDVVRAVEEAAARTGLHGRWEKVSDKPVTICDIGHNPPALEQNFAALEAALAEGSFTSLVIVYGVMADKDLDSIIPLMPRQAAYVFVTPSTPRALPAAQIASRFKSSCNDFPVDCIYIVDDVGEALDKAVSLCGGDPLRPAIYVGGSAFVVADALKTRFRHLL